MSQSLCALTLLPVAIVFMHLVTGAAHQVAAKAFDFAPDRAVLSARFWGAAPEADIARAPATASEGFL